ncbi:MAG: hypothetical protein HPY50_09240 [Firmicutes bacterium]|nr:hypothetical protein [Bacillota bacterium]
MDTVFLLIGDRVESAVRVQSILSQNGDIIRTRLGINREIGRKDMEASGFVFLELCADESRVDSLVKELNSLERVRAEHLRIELP